MKLRADAKHNDAVAAECLLALFGGGGRSIAAEARSMVGALLLLEVIASLRVVRQALTQG